MLETLFYAACACTWSGEALTIAGWTAILSRRSVDNGVRPRFSVVVCFHNEAAVVERCLDALAALDYPDFEWVLVDDRSCDGTSEILRRWASNRPRAKYVRLDGDDPSPKKRALLAGAAAAEGEWLALTDADCAPPPDWLHALARAIRPHAPLVAGYSPYRIEKRGLLGFFIRMETEKTALEYLGRSALGWHYMAVGRNMAVRRQTLLDDGFQTHRDRLSGSDDLLARRHAVAPCIEAHVPSLPPRSWREWWNQKTRHVSASAHYAPATQAALATFQLGRPVLWAFALTQGRWEGLAVLWILQTTLYILARKSLSLRPNMLQLAIFDGLLTVYHLTVAPTGRFRRPTWKKT
ncbi:MAG: glycosyltransferase [Bacteroidia bacterium]|nr:glycosyltransferase [Bacteroidia bacterium]MDW8333208.1 glycosyltransferase [Bacteroidia bacterium]